MGGCRARGACAAVAIAAGLVFSLRGQTSDDSRFVVLDGVGLRHLARVRPYVAAGFGSYGYKETSTFAEAGEDVDTRHAGFVLNGGAEFRLHRWIGLAADVQYSHVPGILGQGASPSRRWRPTWAVWRPGSSSSWAAERGYQEPI